MTQIEKYMSTAVLILTLRSFAPWRLCVRLPLDVGRFAQRRKGRKEKPQSKTLLALPSEEKLPICVDPCKSVAFYGVELNLRLQSRPMCIDRRNFLRASAGVAGAAMLPSFAFADSNEVDAIQQRQDVPDLIKNLRPMIKDVVPITEDERKARIAKAQRLMGEQKIDAIYIESGTSMYYFTGMR